MVKKLRITVNGTVYEVEVEEIGAGAPAAAHQPQQKPASVPAQNLQADSSAAAAPSKPAAPAGAAGSTTVKCPMPGTVVNVFVSAGQQVKAGQKLLVLEAMKMENDIVAPRDGEIASVNVSKGASVNTGDILLSLK